MSPACPRPAGHLGLHRLDSIKFLKRGVGPRLPRVPPSMVWYHRRREGLSHDGAKTKAALELTNTAAATEFGDKGVAAITRFQG